MDNPLSGMTGLLRRMNQVAACGLQMMWIEDVKGGALSLSPRLAKALRTYGHRQMHLLGAQAYLDGLCVLEADSRVAARTFAPSGLTLVWLTAAGNRQNLTECRGTYEPAFSQSA
jgi:hypothetical protein